MQLQNSTERPRILALPRTLALLLDESGNGLIEFVAWFGLVMIPLAGLVIAFVDTQVHLAAAQNLAREIARAASLGANADVESVLKDFGVKQTDFDVRVDCVSVETNCDFKRVQVALANAASVPSVLPAAQAIFKVQTN